MAMLEGSISIWASMNSWFTPTVLFGFLNLMIVTIFLTSSLATHKHNEDQKQQQPHQLARSPSMLQRIKSINFYNYKSQEPTTNYATTPDFNTYFSTQHQEEPQQQQQTHFTPPQEQQQQQQPYFSRSPSMLQRLKSINLYSYLSQESTSPSTSTTSTNHKIQETKTTHDSFQQTDEQEPEEEQEEEDELELEQEQTLDEIYSQLQGNHVSGIKTDAKPASGEIPTKPARKMKKSASAKSVFKRFEEENIVEARRPATVREGKGKVTEDDDEVDAKADDFINKFKHQLKLQRIDSIIRSGTRR